MDEKKIDIANSVGAATEKALEFVEKIIAGPLIEGTGIFTDKVKYWRFKNQVKIILKAKKFLKDKGIDTPNKIPLKDISTLLEYASFEEDEKKQDSWANLLANTLNPENSFNACHVFSQVLNQISIEEINILEYMFNKSFLKSSENRPYFEKNDLIRMQFTSYDLTLLLFDNLLRLRIIEDQPPKFKEQYYADLSEFQEAENEIIASDNIRLSKFGIELLRKIEI
jgi:hypothetical protein